MLVKAEIKDVVKNYDLHSDEGFLFCLFEAVSNSLYCCIKNQYTKITINITRQYAANEINKDKDNNIVSFKITDNGVGFTDDNFDKFAKRIFKTNHDGGKGWGRISFLKVFNNVRIKSVFREENKTYRRFFAFDQETIKDKKTIAGDENENETVIVFNDMKEEFQEYTTKDVDHYQNEIIKHFYIFLYYLIEEKKQFEIKIIDDSGKESERIINTAMLKKDRVKTDKFSISDKSGLDGIDVKVDFELLHIKSKNIDGNKAFYVVDERSAGEIANLDLPQCTLGDESGFDYYYHAYLKSSYFNRFLNESRTKLSLPVEKKNTGGKIITEEKIRNMVNEKIKKFLNYELNILSQKNETRVIEALKDENNNKISNAKGYLYILSDDETKKELLNLIKYSDNAKMILSKIRNFHEELQANTVNQIHAAVEILKKDEKAEVDFDKLERDIKKLSEQANIENSVNLSSYIMYRKYILDLLDEGIRLYEKSKKQNERFFHDLLMPKGSRNTKDSNLWLLDDIFLYFEGASERRIEDITINGNKIIRKLSEEEKYQFDEFNRKRMEKRIDLLFFPEQKKCIIIELKDPKEGVKENTMQMDKYAELIANFIMKEYSIENFYTYLITDNFNKFDRPTGYRKIYGIEGFVRSSLDIQNFENGQTIANQYAEVIRYKDIHRRADNRNKIFLEKLNVKGQGGLT